MRSGRRYRALALFALAFGLMGVSSPSFAASPRAVEIEDVRVGFGDRFKIGAWTPVRVQVRSTAEAFEGLLEVVAMDDDGTPTRTRLPLRLNGGDTTRLTAYTRAGSRSPNFLFRFLNKDGLNVGEVSLETLRSKGSEPSPLFPDDVMLLALGNPQGVELISAMPGLTTTRQGGSREVFVQKVAGSEADLLPGKAQGYGGVDTIVLDTNDKDLMASLSTRGEALTRWVAQGGHLVVAVGLNWQAVRESVLAPILPVKLAGPTRVTDLRALESFASANSQITPDNVPAQVIKLEGADANGTKILSTTSSTPLVVRGTYGFGRVTVIAFDVDAPPFSSWPDRNLFWVKALDLSVAGVSGTVANRGGGRLVQSGASDLSTLLRTALDQFAGVQLVPFGWVAFLIFLYIILIGPFDYFFLKKVVKRMELTWITFPLIVIAVSVAATYAAYRLKGTELRMNQVDLVDLDLPAKQVRGATFLNVYSPANRDYEVGVKPLSLVGSAAPAAGLDTRMSWLGSADTGLRGMNGSARGLSFVNEGYLYAPDGSADRIEGLRIPIWSTKSLSARWFGPSTDVPVDSDLQQVGPDRLSGTVTNRLDVPMNDTVIAFGTQVYYNLGTIAPGATVRVELSPNRQLSGYLGELRRSYEAKGDGASRPINRANLLRAIMFHDSETSGIEPLANAPLRDLDLTGQLRLDRPMLVAQIDRPVVEVNVGPDSGSPKVTRTTLLRVILPLDRSGETAGNPAVGP